MPSSGNDEIRLVIQRHMSMSGSGSASAERLRNRLRRLAEANHTCQRSRSPDRAKTRHGLSGCTDQSFPKFSYKASAPPKEGLARHCSKVAFSVSSPQGLPTKLRMPTTKPSSNVVARRLLVRPPE
jgi:hypothetical protein